MIGLRSRGASWAPWGASVRFAERLSARHVLGSSRSGGVGRVVLRAVRASGRVAARHEWRGVRLELRVRVERAGADGGDRRSMVGPWGPPPLSMYGRSSTPPSSVQRTTEHPIANRGRIERVPAGLRQSPSAPVASYARPFPAVPRILRRGASSDSDADADSRHLPFHRAERSTPVRASAVAQGAPLTAFTPPELDRLTNRVVDAIDRRLAAYRERHGRG